MALRIVQSPGCSDVLTEAELGLEIGEILIDTGKIAESIGFLASDPDANRAFAARGGSYAVTGHRGRNRGGRQRHHPHVEPAAGKCRAVAPARGRGCRAEGANHAGGSVSSYQALGAGR